MSTSRADTAVRPPRAMAWVVLVASAAAVALTGVAATTIILGSIGGAAPAVGRAFWLRFLAACALTVLSLGIRSLRWVFLLRRADVRVPIRDAYIGYFAGLSLLLAPLLIGEIAVRAVVLRTRGGVPVATTAIVNLWERLLDVAALGVIAGGLGLVGFDVDAWAAALVIVAAATLVAPLRRGCLRAATAIGSTVGRVFDRQPASDVSRFGRTSTWIAALLASTAAWMLPGLGLWLIAGAWTHPFGALDAVGAYATSTGRGTLAPAGVIVAGTHMMTSLESAGFLVADAAVAALGVRLATVGVATVLGVLFLVIHRRTPFGDARHFDTIADAYDVQIAEGRRLALLDRKTAMMRDVLTRLAVGARGLDVGCGQGAYVARMRELGFDVGGIDASAGQVAIAERKMGGAGLVTAGSVLDIPARDATYDFVYVINVLHHLGSVQEQRRAFAELLRVLRPGGVLFVHEINTRNVLFRFYMGYVFPSLNCIDEGVERWLLPHRFEVYTDVPVAEVRYFTFFPDFLPQAVVRLLTPVERWLERSRLDVYSAHYMAVLRKGGA